MDPQRAELLEKIKAQGDVVRKLKEQKAEKSLVRSFSCCNKGHVIIASVFEFIGFVQVRSQ